MNISIEELDKETAQPSLPRRARIILRLTSTRDFIRLKGEYPKLHAIPFDRRD